jgi:hypothetical protein
VVARIGDLLRPQAPADELRVIFADETGKKQRHQTGETQRRLTQLSQGCVRVLEKYWAALAVRHGFGVEPDAASAAQPVADDGLYPLSDAVEASIATVPDPWKLRRDNDEQNLRRWLRLAEDFVAGQTVLYITRFFVHLRNLVKFLLIASLGLLIAVNAYTMQPHRLLLMICTLVAATVAGVILVFFVQMDRDELVSRITRTIPNRLSLDRSFGANVLTYVVPLIGVLVAQIPDVRDLIGPWLDPILRVLK